MSDVHFDDCLLYEIVPHADDRTFQADTVNNTAKERGFTAFSRLDLLFRSEDFADGLISQHVTNGVRILLVFKFEGHLSDTELGQMAP